MRTSNVTVIVLDKRRNKKKPTRHFFFLYALFTHTHTHHTILKKSLPHFDMNNISIPYYSRARNTNGSFTSSYWTKNMNTRPQHGTAANAWNDQGQVRAHNGTGYNTRGQLYNQRGCENGANAYTRPGPGHTRTFSGKPISDRILKTRDMNTYPLHGPGAYNTNAYGTGAYNSNAYVQPTPTKKTPRHSMNRRPQKAARGRPWIRKTRRQEAKKNSTNDAKVDTWLNKFTDSLIKPIRRTPSHRASTQGVSVG